MSVENPSPSSGPARVLRGVLHGIPTLLVLAALGAVGWWGHRTGWKTAGFAQLLGKEAASSQEDWCAEHNVPESRCIKCNPQLVGANMKDWCPEHGVPESRCTICHPEILKTGVAGDWCPEHGLPESSCTRCHPEIAVKGPPPASESGVKVTLDPGVATRPASAAKHDDHDHDHGPAAPQTRPAADAHAGHDHGHDHGDEDDAAGEGGHSHARDPKTCQTHALRVQFASAQAVRKAGLRLSGVVERPMSNTLTANAELSYDRNRHAQVASPVAGRIWRVEKEVGQTVTQGELLALIDAAEVGRAKAELLQAAAELDLKNKTVKRLRASAESGFRTDAELQEAEAAVKLAGIRLFNAQQSLVNLGLLVGADELGANPDRQAVQFLGLPRELAQSLDPKKTTANLLPLLAPFEGVVIERSLVPGQVIETGKALMAIADTRQMWVNIDVPLADAPRLALGQGVYFRPDGAPDRGASGKISWISTAVDDQTRTVKVRAVVENSGGRLLANAFGKAEITLRQKATATVIPAAAIQWEGCCHIVFVRLTEDIFQVRKVRLGTEAGGFAEVTNGLLVGEVVVAEGSHVLKSEILKSSLGAGCADGH